MVMFTCITINCNYVLVIHLQKESDFYGTIHYSFVFGDGVTTDPLSRESVNTASHVYTAPGDYVAKVSLENLAAVVSVTNNVYIQGIRDLFVNA